MNLMQDIIQFINEEKKLNRKKNKHKTSQWMKSLLNYTKTIFNFNKSIRYYEWNWKQKQKKQQTLKKANHKHIERKMTISKTIKIIKIIKDLYIQWENSQEHDQTITDLNVNTFSKRIWIYKT
jgi:hypothetical protein